MKAKLSIMQQRLKRQKAAHASIEGSECDEGISYVLKVGGISETW